MRRDPWSGFGASIDAYSDCPIKRARSGEVRTGGLTSAVGGE